MIDLLLATENAGKQQEYQQLLEDLPVNLIAPADRGLKLTVVESGTSFAENAALKARAYARASGLLSLADDSGLEVDALGGKPGVHSARYGGPDFTDADRIALILADMEGIPWDKRTARFRCVIAIASPADGIRYAEGRCAGYIARAPSGTYGFGYDPIFYVPRYRKTMAELPPSVKNEISHRARAARLARTIVADIAL